MSFIESYESQLVQAAREQRDARLRNRVARRFRLPRRRGPAIALAALLVGVPAATATVARWNPFDDPDRNQRFPAPTLSQNAPDARLAATLGVLRRPQSDADRGVVSSNAVKKFAVPGYAGAQLDAVRLIDEERGIVLVPFERAPVPRDSRGRAMPGFAEGRASDVACLFERTSDGFGSVGCHSADKIARGLAISSDSDGVAGLVPDGVATVRLIRGDERAEAPVRDNLFVATDSAPRAPSVIQWLRPDGSVVKEIDVAATARAAP